MEPAASSTVVTRFDPSETDRRIVAVLDARRRVEEAMVAHDLEAVRSLLAPDLIVNAPINRVVDHASVMARLEHHQIDYDSVELRLEFAGVRGDLVVLMGEEIVRPTADAPNAGKTVRRRFTDIWREIDGAWRLGVRQGTAVAIE